jgi:FkbM family methyltransferase
MRHAVAKEVSDRNEKEIRILDLNQLNEMLLEQKSLLFSQGFFYTNIEKNGEGFLLERVAPLIDIFLDCGCNKGYVSNYIYQHNKNIEFHLFDIVDKDFIEFNAPAMKYNQTVLGDQIGTEFVYSVSPKNNWNSSEVSSLYLPDNVNCKTSDFIRSEFPSTTLDSYSENLGNRGIIFLKLDIEGSEIKCLRGATNFLDNFNVAGYLEYNPRVWEKGGYSYKQLYRFMLDLDFLLFRITPLGLKKIPYYSELNESNFCYYFFCRPKFLENLDLENAEIERKLGINKSEILLF